MEITINKVLHLLSYLIWFFSIVFLMYAYQNQVSSYTYDKDLNTLAKLILSYFKKGNPT